MVLASVFTDLLDWLADFSGDVIFLPIIFVIALADSVIPVVPSETLVIIGGVAAGQGDQLLPLVIACGAVGAFIGDNIAYKLGASAQGFMRRTLFRGDKGAKRLEWAEDQLSKRGGMLLVTARFIPGGRTAITIASGLTHQPRVKFIVFDAIACIIWATYAGLLGFVGGKTFQDDHTKAFLVAFAMAISATVLIEVVRWTLHRRKAAD